MTRKTILISSARSGTNFFLSTYSAIFPEHCVFGEIFRENGDNVSVLTKKFNLNDRQLLDMIRERPVDLWERLPEASIAKIFYSHKSPDSEVWRHFRDHNRIIHLIRTRHLENFVSLKIAERTGNWVQRKQSISKRIRRLPKRIWYRKKVEPLRIDPEELRSFVASREEKFNWCREFFWQADYHEVRYEDILQSTDQCAAVIGGIFGVVPRTVEATVMKQSKDDHRALIANYGEIAHLDTH